MRQLSYMTKKIFILLSSLLFFLSFPKNSFARSGCCSGHGGVSCAAGPQSNGHVICNDGWTGSSCLYSGMVMCEGYITASTPTPTPNWRPSTPTPTIRITVPTATATPTNKPTNTSTPTPTGEPTQEPKVEGVADEAPTPTPTPTTESSSDGSGAFILPTAATAWFYYKYRQATKNEKKGKEPTET